MITDRNATISETAPTRIDCTCSPLSPVSRRIPKRTKKNSPNSPNTIAKNVKIAYGLYMMYDRMIAPADFIMCSRIDLNSRDSRVFGFVRIGTLTIFSFLLPAWMIVSMQ